MDKIDQFLQSLNGGLIALSADYAETIEAYVTRIQAEDVLEEAQEISDFAILTPNKCYEFAYYEPEIVIVDRREDMPYNPNPNHAGFVEAFTDPDTGILLDDWPVRRTAIDGLTIHHTLSDNPLGLFQWITRRVPDGKGYPRGQYHYWVSRGEGAPISQLLDESVQCWHDSSCQTYSTRLSIGMAGHLGHERPPEEQLWNTVRLCWYLILQHGLTVDDVDGHTDRAVGVRTVCPGWYADSASTINSGVWRRDFDIALQCAADGKEWPGYNA
jgi:hypothetical protein